MNEKIRQFLALAKQVSLRDSDREAMREELIQFLQQDQHLTSAKEIMLSESEKDSVRDALSSFMYDHPVLRRSGFSWQNLFSTRFVGILTVVALLVTTTGTMAYAAEDAVPGDFLYSVKVDFTEPILEKMSLSAEARTQWNLRRVERRLREAETLQKRKEFDPDRREQLERRLEQHMEVLQNRIDRMHDRLPDTPEEATDGVDVRLVVMLEAHEKNLALIESGAVAPMEVKQFAEKVRRHREIIRDKRIEFEEECVKKFGTGAVPPEFFIRVNGSGILLPPPPFDEDGRFSQRIEHRIGSGSTESGYVIQEIEISESGSHIRVHQESRTHVEQHISTGSGVRIEIRNGDIDVFRNPPPPRDFDNIRKDAEDRIDKMRGDQLERMQDFFEEELENDEEAEESDFR